jgi:hypothetical protein
MQNVWIREEVIDSLEQVLSDAKFAAAPKLSAFLRFVVMQTLDGNAERIKAYTVAVDALGKPMTFDPQNDPSVRVLAKRLRETLSAYYERTSDHNIIIKLVPGSYVPKFLSIETPAQHVSNTRSFPINNELNESKDSATGVIEKSYIRRSEPIQ